MKILFPILNNEKPLKLSLHFGHAPYFAIYDSQNKQLKIENNDLNHNDANKSPVDQIVENFHPDIVVVKDIGSRAINLFNQKGVKVMGSEYELVEEIIGKLDELKEKTNSCNH